MRNKKKIANHYAHALFLSAQAKGLEARVAEDLSCITQAYASNPAIALTLNQLNLKPEQQRQILKALFQAHLCPVTWHWLQLLVAKKRLHFLTPSIAHYHRHYKTAQRCCTLHMTTAIPLSKAEQNKYARQFQAKLGCAAVDLVHHVDPTLISGFLLQIGDKRIDNSIQGMLRQLRTTLLPSL